MKALESKFLCCAYNIRVVSHLESISPSSRAELVACRKQIALPSEDNWFINVHHTSVLKYLET